LKTLAGKTCQCFWKFLQNVNSVFSFLQHGGAIMAAFYPTQKEQSMTLYLQSYPYARPRRWVRAAQSAERTLAVNIRDESESFVLTALVPGLTAEQVNISVLEDVVRIEGEYPQDENEYLLRELTGGSFHRALRLPAPVDAARVEARIAEGVLTLRLPKAESARPKTIKIQSK
jgi:HSP20 family protein